MPEHVHVLLLPDEGVRISRILTAIKQPVAQRAVRWMRQNAPGSLTAMAQQHANGKVIHRFWQRGGGYDRNLRSDRDVHEKLHYVHDNPRRRGLVASLKDWPWSSWHAWQTGRDEPIPIDRDSFPILVTR